MRSRRGRRGPIRRKLHRIKRKYGDFPYFLGWYAISIIPLIVIIIVHGVFFSTDSYFINFAQIIVVVGLLICLLGVGMTQFPKSFWMFQVLFFWHRQLFFLRLIHEPADDEHFLTRILGVLVIIVFYFILFALLSS